MPSAQQPLALPEEKPAPAPTSERSGKTQAIGAAPLPLKQVDGAAKKKTGTLTEPPLQMAVELPAAPKPAAAAAERKPAAKTTPKEAAAVPAPAPSKADAKAEQAAASTAKKSADKPPDKPADKLATASAAKAETPPAPPRKEKPSTRPTPAQIAAGARQPKAGGKEPAAPRFDFDEGSKSPPPKQGKGSKKG